jgi:hypothetical protein
MGSLFGRNILLGIERQQRQVENERKPVAVDQEQDSEESVDSGFGDDVGVKTVAEVNGVDVVTAASNQISLISEVATTETYHSRSLYMIVKKTCRNRLTALMSTANR